MNNFPNNVIKLEVPDSIETTYLLALESIFRWTLRRDEFSDAQIILAIKKVAMTVLETF